MFKNVVPVSKQRHALKKIKNVSGFGFAAPFHIAYVTLQEFARAASIFPVVFIEDKAKTEFRPVVMLGLKAGENLFVDADGKWQASYVPAIIRRYPFALTPAGTDGQFMVCLDEGSDLINDTEGTALFDEKGEPTQVIENVKRYLSELQQMEAQTVEFCRFLAEKKLFSPLNMRVRGSDAGVRNISGASVVNEEALGKLSDEEFLELRRKGYLPALYAHLMSLAQVERLVKLQDEAKPLAAAAAA